MQNVRRVLRSNGGAQRSACLSFRLRDTKLWPREYYGRHGKLITLVI